MAIIILSLLIAILLESTVTTIPLVLSVILFIAIVKKSPDVFAVAFFAGLLLDLISLGYFGFSSLYLTIIVFIIYSYQKKFEIETFQFLAIFSYIGSLIYLFIKNSDLIILQSGVVTLITLISFFAYKKFNKKTPKYA